jgi:biopolymer transport protein ExbD
MKTTTTLLLLVCFNVLSTFGQQRLELSLKKDTDEPTSKTEHVYVIEVKNVSNNLGTFYLNANNTSCNQINISQVDLKQELLQINNLRIESNKITLKGKESYEFIVKISRPLNTKLNTWNCTEITAVSQDMRLSSNPLIIKTFIPNPKDFN